MMGFFVGALIGAAFTRRKKILWEDETSLVIAKMDRIGIILLAVYIPYVIFRHQLLGHWFYGHELTAFSFSLAAGSTAGRVLSMRTQIRQVLKRQKLL